MFKRKGTAGINMLKKWLEIIYDHKVSLRERMFRLITGISMVALF